MFMRICGVALTGVGCIAILQNIAIALHGVRDLFRPPEQRRFVSFVPFVGGLSVFLGLRMAGCGNVGLLGFLFDPFWIPQFVCALIKALYLGLRFLLKKLMRLVGAGEK